MPKKPDTGAHTAEPVRDETWAERRRRGIPPRRGLFILACMDERIPIEKLLGIELGDAHICRNAGGVVTEDVLRSAMISTRFSGTREIVVINHTDCGLLHTTGERMIAGLKAQGLDLAAAALDPDLPEFRLGPAGLARWLRAFDDLEAFCQRQVEILRHSPLIAPNVAVAGYIFDCAAMTLRQVARHP